MAAPSFTMAWPNTVPPEVGEDGVIWMIPGMVEKATPKVTVMSELASGVAERSPPWIFQAGLPVLASRAVSPLWTTWVLRKLTRSEKFWSTASASDTVPFTKLWVTPAELIGDSLE